MRRIFLATSIALALVFFAVLIINNITEAQRPERPDRPERDAQRQRPQRARATGLTNLLGGIRDSFWQVAIMMDTNDEQLVQIRAAYKEMLKDVMTKGEALREQQRALQGKARELEEGELREQRRELSQQTRELISGINTTLKDKLKVTLTEEQFAKYEEWYKNRQERARRTSGNRGGRQQRGAGRSESSQPAPAEKGE